MVYLGKRRDCDDDNNDSYCDDDYESWWYTDTAEAIKWAVVIAIFAILMFLLAAYLHAKRRVRAGQAPLKYHRVG